jgi:GrpB-like predicted nucleotidyltransferase (UPF0157 family)
MRIDHIGSTAVTGLAAKPTIDIDVSVANVEDEASYLPALERAGYELLVREPGYRMVNTPARDVHVHICTAASDWERRHLRFAIGSDARGKIALCMNASSASSRLAIGQR